MSSSSPAPGSGLVFDIQRFSIHDGPGIRTTVFFKGCALGCLWCQNPEAISCSPEILFTASSCIDCRQCAKVCSSGAISLRSRARIDTALCLGCGACADACPAGALQRIGRERSVADLVAEVQKDEAYYRRSGGGMTLSGGEPLLQADFVLELLYEARRLGIHTVVETAGHLPADSLRAAAPLTDLFYFDLKLMDSETHRRFTGAGNERILANARMLTELRAQVEYRLPLLPGINDADDNLDRTAAFALDQGSTLLRIVPYQRTYLGKMHAIRTPEEIRAIGPPTPELLARVRERLCRSGLKVELDG